jgi:hypothetical protein
MYTYMCTNTSIYKNCIISINDQIANVVEGICILLQWRVLQFESEMPHEDSCVGGLAAS